MVNSESFRAVLDRLEAGSESAAARVYDWFAVRLVALARAQMASRVRVKVDPEEVVQSVFKSFFRRRANGDFDLDGPDDLWALLSRITTNKCRNVANSFRTGKREVGLELSADFGGEPRFGGRESPPDEALIVSEMIEAVGAVTRDWSERDRGIIDKWLAGCSHEDVRRAVGCSSATVKRVIHRFKDRVARVLAAEAV